jgi:hypothetical protein
VVRAGGRIVEVPVRRGPRPHGASRLNSVRDGARILRRIVALRLGAGTRDIPGRPASEADTQR